LILEAAVDVDAAGALHAGTELRASVLVHR
jgi:hypothetical protein